MKRRIYWGLVLLSGFALFLTVSLILTINYNFYSTQVKKSLRNEAFLLAQAYNLVEEYNRADFLEELAYPGDLRITLVSADGVVFYDSAADAEWMENHKDRAEIAAALESQSGEAIRRSQTLGKDTYYFALRLDNSNVLRVSRDSQSIFAVFINTLPPVGVIFMLLLIACLFISSSIARVILKPLNKLANNMEGAAHIAHFEELNPFFNKIQAQNQIIQSQIEGLKAERDTVKTITDNMREGLILLDINKNILSVNRSAIALLGAREMDYEGKSFLAVSRQADFIDLVNSALKGQSRDAIIENDLLCQNIFASPVFNGEEICGAIILILDITEKRKAEKLRREFSSNVSHEIKTPLTSISGFAEMLKDNMVSDPEDIKKFAGLIYSEAKRLVNLTEDILRLSEIEEGALPPEDTRENTDIYGISKQVLDSLKALAEENQVELKLKGEKTLIFANARMMDELITNLCVNAIKYNRPGGKVDVEISMQPKGVLIDVSDTGIGIPREHQSRIFQRFYRVDKSRSKETGGTGLGLSIVKHIVDYHGGSISLSSREGEGTRIKVFIPQKQD